MEIRLLRLPLLMSAMFLSAVYAQLPRENEPPRSPAEVRLPNGKLQQDEIIRADREKSIKEAAQLIDMAESLKKDLEKDDAHVLSISTLKKTEEIEKLAKRIRSRLKRF